MHRTTPYWPAHFSKDVERLPEMQWCPPNELSCRLSMPRAAITVPHLLHLWRLRWMQLINYAFVFLWLIFEKKRPSDRYKLIHSYTVKPRTKLLCSTHMCSNDLYLKVVLHVTALHNFALIAQVLVKSRTVLCKTTLRPTHPFHWCIYEPPKSFTLTNQGTAFGKCW